MANQLIESIYLIGFNKQEENQLISLLSHTQSGELLTYHYVRDLEDVKQLDSAIQRTFYLLMFTPSLGTLAQLQKTLREEKLLSSSIIFYRSDEINKEELNNIVGFNYLLDIGMSNLQLLDSAIASIRERRRLKGAVKLSIERYRSLFDHSPVPMWIYNDSDLSIIRANGMAQKLYGYTEEEFLNLNVKDLCSKEDIPELLQAIEDYKKNAPDSQSIFRHRKKNGAMFYVEINHDAIEVDDINARIVLITDITQRLEAEKALSDSELRFKALVKYGSDLSLITNKKGVITYLAPSALGLFGESVAKLVGINIFSIIHKEDLPEYKARFREALRVHKKLQMPLIRVRNPEGFWRWIDSKVTDLTHEPVIDGLIINGKDVTNDYENQLKLYESIERYENTAKVTGDAIYTTNFELNITHTIGPVHEELYGLDPIVHKDKLEFWKNNIHPDDRERVLFEFEEILRSPKVTMAHLEYRLKTKKGQYLDVMDSVYITRKNGEPYEAQGAIRDISKQKFHDRLLSFEKEIYELNAVPQITAAEILQEVARKVENFIPGSKASILEVCSDNALKTLAAPSLPLSYSSKIDGVKIGAKKGSCGTAIYLGQNVIVKDIKESILWEEFADLALTHNLRACWSVPIKLKNGETIGSFATYYGTVKTPSEYELTFIEAAANVLGILMQGWKALEAKEKMSERFNLAARATKDIVWDHDVIKGETIYNEGIHHVLGYPIEERKQYPHWWAERIHPDDYKHAMEALEKLLTIGTHEPLKYRFRCANGQYKYFEDSAYAVRDENGKTTRIIGAMHDITEMVNHMQEIEAHNEKLKQINWRQSHEVRAPLARIMGLVELLDSEPKEKNSEHAIIFEYLKASTREMDEVIRSIVSEIDTQTTE
jgi:PAS domain S-box-containing protein